MNTQTEINSEPDQNFSIDIAPVKSYRTYTRLTPAATRVLRYLLAHVDDRGRVRKSLEAMMSAAKISRRNAGYAKTCLAQLNLLFRLERGHATLASLYWINVPVAREALRLSTQQAAGETDAGLNLCPSRQCVSRSRLVSRSS